MAMKPVATLVLVAAFSIATVAATAKTVTSSQGNANDKSVAAVAGSVAAANNSGQAADTSSAQPAKKALKKSKVKAPPPMHDPN
jgi:hypothetical protein